MKTIFTFYVVVFAYQNPVGPARPADTHVWAVFYKCQDNKPIERVVISWGPAPGSKFKLTGSPVPGSHRSFESSLADTKAHKWKSWKLNCGADFYEAARFERDQPRMYKVLDGKTRDTAKNCEHYCLDVVGPPYVRTGLKYGIAGGQSVVDHYIKSGKAWTYIKHLYLTPVGKSK